MDGRIVHCAVERSLYFVFVLAVVVALAVASEVGPGFSPGIQNRQKWGL
jgi:hypothetical protein